jgi:hypothetical protein
MCHQVLTKPCQKQVKAEGASDKDSTTTAKPMIERNGQPAADKCTAEVGAELTSPKSQVDRGSLPPMPNWL